MFGWERRTTKKISPNIVSQLEKLDAHFVLKHFEKKYVEHHGEDGSVSFDDMEVRPKNSEKYFQFQIGNLRFLDSFQFLSTSLEALVSLLLKSGKNNFVHTTAHLGTDDDIIFAKGVYPYSYVDSCEKFSETQLLDIVFPAGTDIEFDRRTVSHGRQRMILDPTTLLHAGLSRRNGEQIQFRLCTSHDCS